MTLDLQLPSAKRTPAAEINIGILDFMVWLDPSKATWSVRSGATDITDAGTMTSSKGRDE